MADQEDGPKTSSEGAPNYWNDIGVERGQMWASGEVVELDDDDLEYVVGGLSPEASASQMRYLQSVFGLGGQSE